MDSSSIKKKITVVILILILTSTMFLSYDSQDTNSSKTIQRNVVITSSNSRVIIFAYNQFGEPISGLAVSMFNGEKNVTNNNGCAAFIPHFGGVISAGYPNLFYCTLFGSYQFNNISCVSSTSFYFAALVKSPNNVLDPAIMIHSFANIKPPQSHSISCAYLCYYGSNTTIYNNNAANENVLQKYTNFTTITVPFSKYMKSVDIYEFSIKATGLVTSFYFSSSQIKNITSSQSRPYTMIWESLFQIAFISSIIALTGVIFHSQNSDNTKGKQYSSKRKFAVISRAFLKSYAFVAIAVLISAFSIVLYSYHTMISPNFTYLISLIFASLFLTGFMTLFYSFAYFRGKEEINAIFILKWAIVIELLWVGTVTLIELAFTGSSDVFNPNSHLINTALVVLQYLNPLEYAISIIEVMNGVIILPLTLPGSMLNYGLNSIFIAIAGFISLIALLIANFKSTGKRESEKI